MRVILAACILVFTAEYTEAACTKEQLRELHQHESALPRLHADVRQAKIIHGLKDHRGNIKDNSEQVAQTEAALAETETKWTQLRQECRTPERDRLEAIYRQVQHENALARAAEREAARPQQEVLDRLSKLEQLQQDQRRKDALDAGIAETQRNWKLDELADRQRQAQWRVEDRLRNLESQVETQRRNAYWLNQELGALDYKQRLYDDSR